MRLIEKGKHGGLSDRRLPRIHLEARAKGKKEQRLKLGNEERVEYLRERLTEKDEGN